MGTADKNTLEYNKLRLVANFDDADPNLLYVGYEHPDSGWMILKIDKTSGMVFTYATYRLNSGIGHNDYPTAWSSRATLNYGVIKDAF